MSKERWHKWFAWYPVKLHKNWAWFEFIYRRKNWTSTPPWEGGCPWWEFKRSLK